MKKWFFPSRFARRRLVGTKKNSKKRVKSACLALGLATAWGGEADAGSVPVRLSVTPEYNMMNAYVLYGNNFSSGDYRLLGTLSAGNTSVFVHETEDDFQSDPPSFAFIGLYDDGGTTGVAFSFPNDDPIVNMSSWEALFPLNSSLTENDVIEHFENGTPTGHPLTRVRNYGHPLYGGGAILAVDFDTIGTIVNFSDPTFGGTITATILPEPTTSFLFMVGAGLALVGRRRDGFSQS